jgi:hypothetical protein
MSTEAESAFVSFEKSSLSGFGVRDDLPLQSEGLRWRSYGKPKPPSSVPEVSGTSPEVSDTSPEVSDTSPEVSSTSGVQARYADGQLSTGAGAVARYADGRLSTGAGPMAMAQREIVEVLKDGRTFSVVGGNLLVDNSIGANLNAMPNGLAAFYLRPFFWEATAEKSWKLRLASVENILWLFLYGFALFGIRPLWRLHPALLVFAASFFLSMGLGASVTQGNLGTTFRHRLQILWVLALLAVVGGEYLWTRWQAQRLRRVEPGLLP